MRCLWLENGEIGARDIPIPVPAPDELLVRVKLAGVCGTDLELERGYYPYTGVPGHEFVGVVEGLAKEDELAGRRVVGEINASCTTCEACSRGHANHCPERTVLGIAGRDGAFAEYLTLPRRNLHLVPEGVDDESAVFTEPLAAACRILEQVELTAATRALVIGAGRLGQLIARVLATTGCRLQVIARHPEQRQLLQAHGIDAVRAEQVEKRAADVTIEATGNPEGFHAAVRATRPGGTIALKSTYRGTIEADFSGLVVDEITLIGSRCGPFDKALSLLASGAVDPRDLIGERFPLERGFEAMAHASRRGAGKVLIEPVMSDEER